MKNSDVVLARSTPLSHGFVLRPRRDVYERARRRYAARGGSDSRGAARYVPRHQPRHCGSSELAKWTPGKCTYVYIRRDVTLRRFAIKSRCYIRNLLLPSRRRGRRHMRGSSERKTREKGSMTIACSRQQRRISSSKFDTLEISHAMT